MAKKGAGKSSHASARNAAKELERLKKEFQSLSRVTKNSPVGSLCRYEEQIPKPREPKSDDPEATM